LGPAKKKDSKTANIENIMIYKYVVKLIVIFSIFSIICAGNVSADADIYTDNFNSRDVSKWTVTTPDTWQVIGGDLSSTGARPGLIFEKQSNTIYISEVDLNAKETRIQNFAQIGFYVYYENSQNYARIIFASDNRGDNHTDANNLELKGTSFTSTHSYINTSINTSIEFSPVQMHHLKVVRLNKYIYVYFNDKLALTTQFKDENPPGKVGFDVYESTGYFDNFYLRPLTIENPTGHINKFNLSLTNPSIELTSVYSLKLDGISKGKATISLSIYGKEINTITGSEGDIVSLCLEDGEEAVNFKILKIFDDRYIILEDIITTSVIDEAIIPYDLSDSKPPTFISDGLYPQLILLLIGLFATLSMRNYRDQKTHSLPLNTLAFGCGVLALFIAGVSREVNIVVASIILIGIGITLTEIKQRNSDAAVLLSKESSMHDLAGILLVFTTAGLIVANLPKWSFVVVVGVLVMYAAVLSWYSEQCRTGVPEERNGPMETYEHAQSRFVSRIVNSDALTTIRKAYHRRRERL